MATLKELQEETKKYKKTLVLDLSEVKLFLKVVEDVDDYYYVYRSFGVSENVWSSCVGSFIPLVDRLSKAEYNYLVNVWNLNNNIQIEEKQ